MGALETLADLGSSKLSTPRVRLRPVATSDYEHLRLAETGELLGQRWRHRGATPSPSSFADSLNAGVVAQFLAFDHGSNPPIGIVTCYGADFPNRFAYLAGAKFQPADTSTHFAEAVMLFVDYVFSCWDFRKLYIESSEFNFQHFSSGVGRILHEEGRLRDHVYAGGRRWDQVIAALYRHEWQEGGWSRQAARLAGGDSDVVGVAASDEPSQVMTWREFLGRFAVEFDLAAEDGLSDRRLVADLGFDSLERLRVELFVESLLSSFRLPEQLGMDDIRVADLYHYYEVAWTRQHGGDSSDGPEAV